MLGREREVLDRPGAPQARRTQPRGVHTADVLTDGDGTLAAFAPCHRCRHFVQSDSIARFAPGRSLCLKGQPGGAAVLGSNGAPSYS